jgi:exonuclease III
MQGKIAPTYRNVSGKLLHQIDHLFVTKNLSQKLVGCEVGDESLIFEQHLSDHLPIIAEFSH